jgi:predicted CXXCH cytochrome family protein
MRRHPFIGACVCILAAVCASAVRAAERPAFPLPPSKQDCSNCHIQTWTGATGALTKKLSALCLDCHPDRVAPQEHQVDMIPPMAVADLPLFGGRMTCATCHDPHTNTYGSLLRKPEIELCRSCHPY